MTGTTDDKAPTDPPRRSLSDGDIATHPRRVGPFAGAPGSDADSHSDADHAASAPAPGTIKAPDSDKDT